jgi:2'-5' RNA ligase
MPVQIIGVKPSPELMNFHLGFIGMMGDHLVSRYPERDGANYLPHITAEYDDKMVINLSQFINQQIRISKIWLLKDIENEDSRAYRSFHLK